MYVGGIGMILLLKTPLGVAVNGATRWINVLGIQFQVAEFLKISVIVVLAYMIQHYPEHLSKIEFTAFIWGVGGFAGTLLLFVSNDLSSSLVIFGVTYFISFIYTRNEKFHIAVAALLEEDCRLKTERPGCLEYYTGIYRNKTMDYLEFYGLLKKKKDKQQDPDTPQKDEQSGKITKSSIRAAQSMEGMIGEDEDADRRLELSEDPFSLYGYSQESRRILMVYLQELLAYDKAPGAALAVMYARVLYQLERLLDADCIERMAQAYMKQKKWSTDPEHKAYQRHLAKATAEIQKYTTATSPIWAMERIGRQTLGQMKVDSEVSLQVNFDAGLAWGEAFVSKLSEPAQIGGMVPWSDVVYLDYYSKEQIENWATDIHNSMAFKTAGIIVQDQALKQFVLDELGNKGRLKKALRDRMQQLQKKEVKRK
jgi:hypothetical protein